MNPMLFLTKNKRALLTSLFIVAMLSSFSMTYFYKKKNVELKILNKMISDENLMLKSINETIKSDFIELGKIPAYNISVAFSLKNTSVLGVVKSGDVSPFIQSIMIVTRDSLYNNFKNNKMLSYNLIENKYIMEKEEINDSLTMDGIKFHVNHLNLNKKEFVKLFRGLKQDDVLANIHEKAQQILGKEKDRKHVRLQEENG